MSVRTVAVIGAGIAGLSTALDLIDTFDDLVETTGAGIDVTVLEASEKVGGRIGASAFAGIDHVDSGADAFLARVPEALELASRVGLESSLVSPEPVGAAVWHDGLHPIPDGLILGLPGRLRPLATTNLLSWRGKLRAAVEPLLPRTSTDEDSIGAFVRARFGDEVHERLVDSLVGSIYATDTDNFSLAEVPQLADLARRNRSLLVGAWRQRKTNIGTASANSSPLFATPRDGINALVEATATSIEGAGGEVRTAARVEVIEPEGPRWSIDGTTYDAVVLAIQPSVSSGLLETVVPEAAALLAQAETADVIMVTLHVGADQWPDRLRGMSGYLVPKPAQRWVTAASFGSQKWSHWRPPAGGEILRVSIGRDGMPVLHLSDDEVLDAVLIDLDTHLGIRFAPLEVRISRWPAAFAQYRPHHAAWVGEVEHALPDGLLVTGAGFHGIGIPACIRHGNLTAATAAEYVGSLQ